MNQNAQMVDESLIDLETGEVVDRYQLTQTAVIEDLPKYARAIRANEYRVALIEQHRKEEIERIEAICNARAEKLKETSTFLMGLAENLMKAAGKERLEYPGLGTFRFGSSRESVNTDEYDDLPDEKKMTFQSIHHGWFRKTIAVHPDKKKIAIALRDGEQIDRFSLNRPHETFTFKVEK